MKWLTLLALIACRGSNVNSDLVPVELQKELVFVEHTIQLQPAGAPTFTVRVPRHWEQDRNLVATIGGREVLVNGANQPLTREIAATSWGDPEMHDGHFEFEISCEGDCAKDYEAHVFAQYSGDKIKILKSSVTPAGRWLIAQNDEGRTYILRTWWPPGATSFRVCWVAVGKRYAAAVAAFEKACAEAVEGPPGVAPRRR